MLSNQVMRRASCGFTSAHRRPQHEATDPDCGSLCRCLAPVPAQETRPCHERFFWVPSFCSVEVSPRCPHVAAATAAQVGLSAQAARATGPWEGPAGTAADRDREVCPAQAVRNRAAVQEPQAPHREVPRAAHREEARARLAPRKVAPEVRPAPAPQGAAEAAHRRSPTAPSSPHPSLVRAPSESRASLTSPVATSQARPINLPTACPMNGCPRVSCES